jgi:hypothetical protein
MIADLRDNGPMVLAKYEKKKRSRSQPASVVQPPHTKRQEAAELSAAIKQTSSIQDKRRNQQFQREESLQRMNERGVEDDPKQLVMSEEDEIEHTLGPNGDLYAKPRKRQHRHKSRHRSGEDLHNDPSYAAVKPKNTVHDTMPPLEDTAYASANHETTSNYSRPSRVRHYRDSDSEITSISSRYQGGQHNVPGFNPHYGAGGVGGGGGGGYNYLPLPHHLRRGPHSSASSVRSSKTGVSRKQGYPHPMMNYPYGYYPTPYPSYGYPYPHYGQSQASAPGHMMYYYYPPPKGRRHKLRRKKLRSRQPSRDPSPPGGIPRKHTDADMGYGPAVVQNRDEGSVVGGAKSKRGKPSNKGFHPQAPPITATDTTAAQQGDAVVNFDGNFIMMKKSDTTDGIQELGGTTLITAKPPTHYDGRWDKYIMTDSEPEHEVDENYCVAFAAESVAILAIGCVSGLKGLRKLRKGSEGAQPDKAYLSSAWDEPPKNRGSRTHSRRDSLTGLADPSLKDVTPEDFAAREEMGQQEGWAGASTGKKIKKKKTKKGGKEEEIELKYRSASAEALDKQPQSELLAGELERQRNASVSRNFGQKMLFNALGARESSMLDIATTSLGGSRNPSVDEAEGDDDEFDETIDMVQGIRTKYKRKNSAKKSDGSSTPERGLEAGERPKSATKKGAKEEERARKEREKEEKKREKMNAKKEKQKKKEDEKRTRQEARERSREATPPRRPTTPKKKSSPTRAAPPPPKSAKSTASSKEALPAKKPASSVSGGKDSVEPQGKLSSSPPLRRRELPPPPPASSLHSRQREPQKPASSSTPLVREESQVSSQRRHRGEKATLRSSPTQPTRSTALSKQTSQKTGREAKQTPASLLQSKPPLGTIAADGGAIQRRNRYFGDSDEEDESVVSAPKWKSNKPAQRPKPSVEKEVESDIADLDAVLAELEGIQTGDLLSWLEPNKVTDIDKAEESGESEDSLPLVVTAAPKRLKNKRPSPPRSRAFGSSPQTKPVGTGAGDDTDTPPPSSATTESNFPSQPRLEEGQNSFPNQQDAEVALADTSSLQRTKHGSPHPGRRRGRANEGADSAVSFTRLDDQDTLGLYEATDGDGSRAQRSTFEQRVISTLEALKESMNQLQQNPSITQTEITEQTQLQQHLMQNLVTYRQTDPQLVNKLISLLTSDKEGLESSSTDQLEQLQQKLLGAHEKTYQETQEHFRNQEALQRTIQRTLEEQAQQQQKGLEANFQMFSKIMQEQLSEQQKKFAEEFNRRKMEKEEDEEEEQEAREKRKKKKNKERSKKKKDKKKKHRRHSDSESDSSHSEDEGTMMVSGRAADMPAVKTMEAQIYTQELLQDTTTQPKLAKGRQRRTSDAEFLRTTEAVSKNFPIADSEPVDDEDDEEMYFQHARPVTIRRADIKVQRQDEYTPRRPSNDSVEYQLHQGQLQVAGATRPLPTDEGHFEDFHILKTRPPKQLREPEKPPEFDEKDLRYGKQHVEMNETAKPAEEMNPLSGAGGELAAALRIRQRQLKNREH